MSRKAQNLLVGLASLTLFDLSAAVAADMPVKAPARAPATHIDWSGFYAGVHAGYRWADANFSSPAYDFDGIAFQARSERYRLRSGLVGLQAGYNVMLSRTILAGLEGDWSWANAKSSIATTYSGSDADGFTFRGVSEVKLTWQATIRGRIGIVDGPWLFYAAGGVAFTQVKWSDSSSVDSGNGAGSVSWTANKILAGWTIGGGIEYMYSPKWIGRIEYLYENFGGFNVPHGFAPQTGSLDLDGVHKLRVAISYRFGQWR